MEYETREYERNYRRGSQAQKEEETENVDFITPVIIVQMAVFLIILTVFFGFYKKQTESFKQIKSFYNSIMQKDMTAKELAEGAKSVFEFLSSPVKMRSDKTEADADYNGAGGEDLLKPKENASFSPVFLSADIVKPVEWKRVSSNFGYRKNPVTGEYGFHSGVDLSAPEGTPVKAAFDGVVERATSSEIRGNYIFLKSGNITTVYCHCSKLLVKEGERIKAGDIIARVGETGQATGPHLHFELRINGIHYNPEWVLKIYENKP